MGKSRIKTRTAYFVVTPEGKLKKINPLLLGMLGVLLLALVLTVANRSYAMNRRLVSERVAISSELLKMNSERNKLSGALKVCEEKKKEICHLLYFNDDTESKAQTGKADEH
ncbi:hypothetical protein LLH00_02950 [bacterium]|nr:hypothetical protein [bacterium]